jgi:hypothetical protein
MTEAEVTSLLQKINYSGTLFSFQILPVAEIKYLESSIQQPYCILCKGHRDTEIETDRERDRKIEQLEVYKLLR